MTKNAVFVKELFYRLKYGEIIHTISAANECGMTPDELRRKLENLVVTSLNCDREYIASRRFISKHCDRKGFWRKGGKVFHVSGSISAVLKQLVTLTPWGLTEAEAEKLTGRECGRMLRAMVEQDKIQRASINAVWVYGRKRNFSQQLKERMTNDRVKIPSADNDRENDFIPLEEILSTLNGENLHTETLTDLTTSLVMLLKSASYRDMDVILRLDARVRSLCGVKNASGLDYTTLCKRFGALQEITLKRLFTKLVRELQQVGTIQGRYLVVDATHLFAWASAKTKKDRSLPFAAWGEHLDSFYGYKVHILIDGEAELPIGVRITPGNPHDSVMYLPLLRKAKADLELDNVIAVFADGAYDDKLLRKGTKQVLHCELYAAMNPRRSARLQAIKARIKDVFDRWGDRIATIDDALRYFGQKLLNEFGIILGTDEESYLVHALKERMNRHIRIAVERVWSRLKFATDFERPMFRKPSSVRKRVYLGIIAMLLVAKTAIRLGIPEDKRRFANVY
jgi:hypothetical protein